MMTEEQASIIKVVYSRLIESESDDWGDLDENLEMWSWLSDKELINETKIKFDSHSNGAFRCTQDHKIEFCFAPVILESVGIILTLYSSTKSLHEKNKYILTYYLAMSEMSLIYSS